MDRLGELVGRGQAEMLGHDSLERRVRPAPVLPARGRRERRVADVGASAPVAGDLPEGGEARVAAVGRDADAVDPGPADDGDAPAALGACPQDGEGVVVDDRALRPAARLDRLPQLLLLAREVDARHVQLGDLRLSRLRSRPVEEPIEDRERLLQAEVLRRALAAADERDQLPVAADAGKVGLRGAAVDGDHVRSAHTGASRCASSGSSSSPASSSWPISGCASSALRATARSPCSAARAASRS